MRSHTAVRPRIIIMFLVFIIQILQCLLSAVTDVALALDWQIFWELTDCGQDGPVWNPPKAWLKIGIFYLLKSIYLVCGGVDSCESALWGGRVVSLWAQAVCLEENICGRPGWQKLGGAPVPACAEGSSCSAITPSFCARLSHFVWRKKKICRGEELSEKNTRQSHRLLNHNSIIVENVFLRVLPPGSERGLLMSCESCAQKQPLFTSVTRSESCLCDDLNFCLHMEPQTEMLRLFNCWWKCWNIYCIYDAIWIKPLIQPFICCLLHNTRLVYTLRCMFMFYTQNK